MSTDSNLFISDTDHQTLSSLIAQVDSDVAVLLQEELDRAAILPTGELPHDVVTMHSEVSFIDLETQKESKVTLVYPHEANIEEHKVSVLAPVGAALIGLRVGQVIAWPLPHGKEKKLKVTHVYSATEKS